MKISFVGAGSITEAMISGLLRNQVCSQKNIFVTNRQSQERLLELEQRYGVRTTYNLHELTHLADIIILAVKPVNAKDVLELLHSYITENSLIISVMAGISIDFIQEQLQKNCGIVRGMPNTSATIGKSATAISFNPYVSEKQKQISYQIFNAIGLTVHVEENQLDIVTAISGSGPAYFYYFVEIMEQAAIDLGIDHTIAKKLITQTLLGAAEMLQVTNEAAETLRKKVTSPGGTTEAGIHVLKEHHVDQAFIECIKAATNRSKELGKIASK